MTKNQLISCFIVFGLLAANQVTQAAEPNHPDQPIVSPSEALSRLKEGNNRFTSGNVHPHESSEERAYLVAQTWCGQNGLRGPTNLKPMVVADESILAVPSSINNDPLGMARLQAIPDAMNATTATQEFSKKK